MADLLLKVDNGATDLDVEPGDLAQDSGLQTAVLLSLFCDARHDEVPAGVDPRGWWADTDSDQWGSRLWALTREVASGANALLARQFAEASLEWMLEDGLADAVTVEAEYSSGGMLDLTVTIERGKAPEWQHLWDAVEAKFQFDGTTLEILVA